MKIYKTAVLIILIVITQHLYGQGVGEIVVEKTYYGRTLQNILNDLARSYDLDMDYNPEDIKAGIIPGKNYHLPLKNLLEELLKESDLDFKIIERQVIIRKKGVAIIFEEKEYERMSDFTLSGVVKDKNTGETLPFAQIIITGTSNGTATNVDGYFTLFNVPSDTSRLDIIYIGYHKKTIFLTPWLVNEPFFVELLPSTTELEGVTVTGEREDLLQISNKVSMVSITPKEIATLPSLGEKDIFRTFQLLPGVSGSNEGSSGLYVRGGTPDQNLILYDGFTVYHVDHLYGMFSAFNSNAIKDVQLYKGGFEAKYGGRLSSVVEIVGKSGNEKHFNIGGDISFLSFNVFSEIPLSDKLTVLLAGRKSFRSPLYNSFFESFGAGGETDGPFGGNSSMGGMGKMGGRQMETAEPKSYFYDLNAKITYKPTDKDIISYSFFNGMDDLDNSRDINRSSTNSEMTGGVNDLTKWGNWGMSTKWSRKWSDVFYSNTLLSYSNYYSIRDRTFSGSRINNGISTTFARGTLEENNLQDFSLKMDHEYKPNKNNQVEFGLQVNHFDIRYDYTRNDTIIIQNREDIGNLYTVYLQDKWKPFEKLLLTPGIRASYYDLSGKIYYEPRFSLVYDVTNRLKVKGAWGYYYQFAKRVIREDIQTGSRDFWILADDETVPVGFSQHYIAGVSYETDKFLFDIEAYYKKLTGLSEYTLQYIPQFGSIDYNEFFYEGDGFARGIEFLVQKKFGKFTGWTGYTLGEVIYTFPVYGENPFHASHDVTHEFKTVGSYKWKKWTFSATWIYATGKPYTEPLGGYQITVPDGSTEDFIAIGAKNAVRYPDYHRLDIAATRHFKLGKTALADINFSVFNLYDHKNIWYKEFEVDEGQLIETDVNLLGITPNITVSFKLR